MIQTVCHLNSRYHARDEAKSRFHSRVVRHAKSKDNSWMLAFSFSSSFISGANLPRLAL